MACKTKRGFILWDHAQGAPFHGGPALTVYRTERAAEVEIADYIKTRLEEFIDGDRDEMELDCDAAVMPVEVDGGRVYLEHLDDSPLTPEQIEWEGSAEPAGAWWVGEDGDYWRVCEGEFGEEVALLRSPQHAGLIAAAPKLLEALRRGVEVIDGGLEAKCAAARWRQQARDAIAAAEGGRG